MEAGKLSHPGAQLINPKILRFFRFMRNAIFGVGGLRDWSSYFLRRSVYGVRKAWARPAMVTESGEVETVCHAMEQSGYFAPSAPMLAIDSVVSNMVDIVNGLIKQSQQKMPDATKTYWVNLNDTLCLSKHDGFVRLLNAPALMDVATQYLGDKPVISFVQLVQTIGSVENISSPQASQKWHVDNDDARIFKFFVYLTDVFSTEDGPFSLAPAPLSKQVARKLLLKLKLRARIPDKDFLECLGSKENVVEMPGKSGAWFVADTHRCYHFGSRSANNRIALFATYISRVSLIRPTMNLAS